METIKLEIEVETLQKAFNDKVLEAVSSEVKVNKDSIQKSIRDLVHKGILEPRKTRLDEAIDWAVENCFREAITEVLEVTKFKDLVAEECHKILKDPEFIRTMAMKKVKSSLGIKEES